MTFPTVRGVIFDLDGLLLDTEPLYLQAAQQVCSRYGKQYTDDVRVQVIGKQELLGAGIIVDRLSLPMIPEEFLHEREKLLEELFPTAKPMPGAIRLTQHLHAHNIPIVIATSSNSNAVKLKLSGHKDWFSIFGDNIITGDNPAVKKGKPAPDIFLAAAARIGIDPKECLVFEDAPSGVQAGKSAGMCVVSVPDPIMKEHNPEGYKIADLVLPSLMDFKPELFGLPPF